MKSLNILVIFLLCFCNFGQIRGDGTIDVTYEELIELNVTCPPYDTCSQVGLRYSDRLKTNECDCDMFCARYDTCCVDSPYKHMPKPNTKPTCRRVSASTGYLMIDQCPTSGESQSAYEFRCSEEWDGENDIKQLVPVTSLFTHITYKNIFCLKCNEVNDDFVSWNVRTEYDGQSLLNENALIQLEYDRNRNSWVAPLGQNGEIVAVSFPTFDAPLNISSALKRCSPNVEVISKCSESWKDELVTAKCGAYMAVTLIKKEVGTLEYRNPHCAICNFEDVNNFICRPRYGVRIRRQGGGYGNFSDKKLFSLSELLDINIGHESVTKNNKIIMCEGNQIWDPFMNKCRTVSCAHPEYVMKNGRCIKP